LDPLGKELFILGRKTTIIGIFKQEGEGMLMDVSLDKSIVVPLNFIKNLIHVENHGPNIIIQAAAHFPIEETEGEVRGMLRSIHRLGPTQEDDLSLTKRTLLSAQLDHLFTIIQAAGCFIG